MSRVCHVVGNALCDLCKHALDVQLALLHVQLALLDVQLALLHVQLVLRALLKLHFATRSAHSQGSHRCDIVRMRRSVDQS